MRIGDITVGMSVKAPLRIGRNIQTRTGTVTCLDTPNKRAQLKPDGLTRAYWADAVAIKRG